MASPTTPAAVDVQAARLVKHKVEQHVSPEIAEARNATLKAMKEAEAGWRRAIDKIGERFGLTKIPDGTWREHSDSQAV